MEVDQMVAFQKGELDSSFSSSFTKVELGSSPQPNFRRRLRLGEVCLHLQSCFCCRLYGWSLERSFGIVAVTPLKSPPKTFGMAFMAFSLEIWSSSTVARSCYSRCLKSGQSFARYPSCGFSWRHPPPFACLLIWRNHGKGLAAGFNPTRKMMPQYPLNLWPDS